MKSEASALLDMADEDFDGHPFDGGRGSKKSRNEFDQTLLSMRRHFPQKDRLSAWTALGRLLKTQYDVIDLVKLCVEHKRAIGMLSHLNNNSPYNGLRLEVNQRDAIKLRAVLPFLFDAWRAVKSGETDLHVFNVLTLRKRIPVPHTDLTMAVEAYYSPANESEARIVEYADQCAARIGAWCRDARAIDEDVVENIGSIFEKEIRFIITHDRDAKTTFEKFFGRLKWTHNRVATQQTRDRLDSIGLDLRESSGYDDFHLLFPLARSLRRELVLHVGPTNSGKTHAALIEAAKSSSATILSPLRLLALEHYEWLCEELGSAYLMTGEEEQGDHSAPYNARTIETANFERVVDVAVIDEVQILESPSRGWAWSNAVVGIPARKVIMTGSENAVPLIKRLAEMMGEHLTIKYFERKTPLYPMKQTVGLNDVVPGDAVIAFSRKQVHEIRNTLVGAGHTVAAIYGSLGPEVRRAEAERFRAGEAQVIVATDAIGMGLNLALKRVLFSTLSKFDGYKNRSLTDAEIKQISGRAGRFGIAEYGHAGLIGDGGLTHRIEDALASENKELELRAFISPSMKIIEVAAQKLATTQLALIVDNLEKYLVIDHPLLVMGDITQLKTVALIMDRFTLPLRDKFGFATSPLDLNDMDSVDDIKNYARQHSYGGDVRMVDMNTVKDLKSMEDQAKRLGLYIWLGRHFKRRYPDIEAAEDLKRDLNSEIEEALVTSSSRHHQVRSGIMRRSVMAM